MRIALLTVFWMASTFPASGQSLADTQSKFFVIVYPETRTTQVDERFLAEAFLKKTTQWPDGELIRPVDLGPNSRVRRIFSEDVLKRSIAEVKIYWQQLIFSGRGLPPPELDSDKKVVRYVVSHPGAIGYVSTTAELSEAKVLNVK